MPSTLEVIGYALRQQNYVAVVGLLMEQKWLQRTCAQFFALFGYGVVVIGISLVIFCTVVLARDAVPAFAVPGTLYYSCLNLLVVSISFNIVVNYVCAVTFSMRLGCGPLAAPTADVLCVKARRARHAAACSSAPMELRTSSSTSESSRSSSCSRDAAEPVSQGTATEPRFAGDGRLPPSLDVTDESTTVTVTVSPTPTPITAAAPTRRLSSATEVAPAEPGGRRGAARRLGHRFLGSGWRCRLRLRSFSHVVCWLVDQAEKLLQRTHISAVTAADASTLAELERMAVMAEQYTMAERRLKLLDAPVRYCTKCQRLKAPREHHCSICNQCVAKMDHHCPFINNCVDAESSRYFFLLVFWLWVGTFLATFFVGNGWVRQKWFERTQRRTAWVGVVPGWNVSEAELAAFPLPVQGPYGHRGVKLGSLPVTLTLTITGCMFVCMCFFVYQNAKLVLGNTTSVEEVLIHDKRHRVFAHTNFVYRTPYDLGTWRNVLESLRTLRDPLVSFELSGGNGQRGPGGSSDGTRGRGGLLLRSLALSRSDRLRLTAWRAALVAWLVALPSARPCGCDGVHYPLYDTETKDADGYCVWAAPEIVRKEEPASSARETENLAATLPNSPVGPDGAEPAVAVASAPTATKEVIWL